MYFRLISGEILYKDYETRNQHKGTRLPIGCLGQAEMLGTMMKTVSDRSTEY